MKKIILLIFSTLLLFSCNSNTPENVTKAFFNHFYKGEFEKAKEYATTDTKSLLSMMESFGTKDQIQDEIKGKKLSFNVIETKIDGNKATCTLEMTNDGEKETTNINLLKIDGKWKVNFSKEDMSKEDGKKKETNKKPSYY